MWQVRSVLADSLRNRRRCSHAVIAPGLDPVGSENRPAPKKGTGYFSPVAFMFDR